MTSLFLTISNLIAESRIIFSASTSPVNNTYNTNWDHTNPMEINVFCGNLAHVLQHVSSVAIFVSTQHDIIEPGQRSY